MTWGFSSYETRFRWAAAVWALLLTVWCMMSPIPWLIRLIGALVCIAVTVLLSLWTAWWRPRSARDIPIFLVADGVGEDPIDPDHPERTFRPAALERLIGNLIAAGYNFQTVSEALAAPLRKSVVLTFDGGTRDLYTVLRPILERFHAKATCFLNPVGEDPRYVSPLEIREMAHAGRVEFGGTCALPDDTVTDEALAEAITRDRRRLTGILGHTPPVFAYPAGGAERLRAAAKAAGYKAALAADGNYLPSLADPFFIPRRRIPRACRPMQAYLLATRGRYRVGHRQKRL